MIVTQSNKGAGHAHTLAKKKGKRHVLLLGYVLLLLFRLLRYLEPHTKKMRYHI
jgi:hypothetical protein